MKDHMLWQCSCENVRTCVDIWTNAVLHNKIKLDASQSKPGCSPPGCTPRRLLIIVDWSVSWFACVQRSTCTSCRIPSHASVSNAWGGKWPRGNVRSQGVNVRSPVYWCCQQKSSRSTSCITLTTVERDWSLWRKTCACWINITWLP